jgi:hypothetical protein
MAVSDFKYSDQSFFYKICKDYTKYLNRTHLKKWISGGSANLWLHYSTGLSKSADFQIFINGIEGTKVATLGDVTGNQKWFYNTGEDYVALYHTDDPNDDSRIESGLDKDAFIDPKAMVYNDGSSQDDNAEYDYIIKKAECLLAYVALLNSEEEYEKADYIYSKVTNLDRTGIVDKINSGDVKLLYESRNISNKGKIIRGSVSGGMDLVQLSGRWSGHGYDKIKIVCVVAGALHEAQVRIYTKKSDRLFGQSETITLNGQLQRLSGGLNFRFAGDSMTFSDTWFVEVQNVEPTNAKSKSIQLWR